MNTRINFNQAWVRNVAVILCMLAGFIFAPSIARAQVVGDKGTPTVFKITLKRFQLSSDGGQTFVTVGSGNLTFDLAAFNAGDVAGTFLTGAPSLSPNTAFDFARCVITCTISLQGNVSTLFTKSGTDVTGNAPAEEGDYTIPANADPTQGCRGGEFFRQGPINPPIVSDASGGLNIVARFDVTNALEIKNLDPNTLGPVKPIVTFASQ